MNLQDDLIRNEASRFADYPKNISKNLLKLKIFYMDFNYETVIEKPAYSVRFVKNLYCLYM